MMRVEQLMTRNIQTCAPSDALDVAARIMWEHDCGCVPVVRGDDGGARVVGMITDRDICMAAYTQGDRLSDIKIESAMGKNVRSCRYTDSIGAALKIFEQNQLHRLPVLNEHDHLIGMLSFADAAREASREHGRTTGDVTDARIGEVIEAISAPRSPRAVVVAA